MYNRQGATNAAIIQSNTVVVIFPLSTETSSSEKLISISLPPLTTEAEAEGDLLRTYELRTRIHFFLQELRDNRVVNTYIPLIFLALA